MTLDSLNSHDQSLADEVPEGVARDNRCVPIMLLGQTMVVGIAPEADPEVKDRLQFILNRPIRLVARSDSWIEARLQMLYPEQHAATEATDEEFSVTYYWPHWVKFEPGTLLVKCSGCHGMGHWTGFHPVRYDDPEIDFWIWLMKQKYYHRVVNETEIPQIKRIWRRYLLRCGHGLS